MAAFDCDDCGQQHPRGCRGHVHQCPVCRAKPFNREEPCPTEGCDGAVTRRPCGKGAIQGSTVCESHGAGSEAARAAAARNVAKAKLEAEVEAERRRLDAEETRLGGRLDVEPADAMLAMVHEAAANVELFRRLVAKLDLDDQGGRSIAGSTGSRSKLNEAAPHVWVTMYDAERERLARFSKMCRDAGVDERRLELAQGQAQMLANVVRGLADRWLVMLLDFLTELDVDDDVVGMIARMWRERWPAIAREQLEAINAHEVDEGEAA